MLNVKVDKNDHTDLRQQVAGEIRRAIAEGEAKPGSAFRRPSRTSENGAHP
jgi:DNA-binding GntR family transcriptional regulator